MFKRGLMVAAGAIALSVGAVPPADAQQRGGVLTFAVPAVKPGLDPARTTTGDGYMLTAMIFSNLTRVDHELQAQPQLARSWEANEDSTEWTFHLRDDAKFHNGRPVVAEDVVFSIKRILDPETASPGARSLGPIADVVAEGDHTVVFKLSGAYADLPLQLGNTYGRIVAEENIEDISHNPIGSGPFRLKEYVPGTRAVVERNPDYFEEGLPYLDEVHQVYIREYAAQVSAIGTGEIHIMYLAPVEIITELERAPGVEVRVATAPSFQPIVMPVQKKPFTDVRVRQALKYAIDRNLMMELATGGLGSVGNDHPVSPGSPWYNKDIPVRERDVEKAKQLLAEAGYPDGIELTFYTSTGRPGLEESALAAQQSAREAGINLRIQSIEIARLFSEILQDIPEMSVAHNNWFGRPTIDETLSPYYYTDSHWNQSGYSDPRMEEMLDKARELTDADERGKIYDQIQQLLHDEGPDVIGYFRNYVSAVREEVRGYRLIPVQYVDLRETWIER
jgi:peptide/nickel transport system substrate-binding protein